MGCDGKIAHISRHLRRWNMSDGATKGVLISAFSDDRSQAEARNNNAPNRGTISHYSKRRRRPTLNPFMRLGGVSRRWFLVAETRQRRRSHRPRQRNACRSTIYW